MTCLSRTSLWPPLLLPRGHPGPLGSPESGCLLQPLLVRYRPWDPQAGSRAHPSLADEGLLGLGWGEAHFPCLSDVLWDPGRKGGISQGALDPPSAAHLLCARCLQGLQQAPSQGTLPTAELFRGWEPHGQTPCRGAGAGRQGPPPPGTGSPGLGVGVSVQVGSCWRVGALLATGCAGDFPTSGSGPRPGEQTLTHISTAPGGKQATVRLEPGHPAARLWTQNFQAGKWVPGGREASLGWGGQRGLPDRAPCSLQSPHHLAAPPRPGWSRSPHLAMPTGLKTVPQWGPFQLNLPP